MTRHALPAFAAVLLLVSGCSQPETPEPAPPPTTQPGPLAVHVLVAEDASPEVESWAEDLRMAVTAGHGQLSLAATPEAAAVVVRIDSVETGVEVDPEPEGEGETSVMRGALLAGDSAREFHLTYRGTARSQAEALARNLRGFAAEAGR